MTWFSLRSRSRKSLEAKETLSNGKRGGLLSVSPSRLQQASSASVSTLLKIMVDSNAPASSRVRAADCVLSRATAAIEIEDVEVRVAALERSAETPKGEHKY